MRLQVLFIIFLTVSIPTLSLALYCSDVDKVSGLINSGDIINATSINCTEYKQIISCTEKSYIYPGYATFYDNVRYSDNCSSVTIFYECNGAPPSCLKSKNCLLADAGNSCDPDPTCTDLIKNQGETGVDCGGPCTACPPPPPTCNDQIQNQSETGIDCGGPCSPCPTCSDKIQNQGETGIDCGGPCGPCCVDIDVDGHYAITSKCPAGNDCNDGAANVFPGGPIGCNILPTNYPTKCESFEK